MSGWRIFFHFTENVVFTVFCFKYIKIFNGIMRHVMGSFLCSTEEEIKILSEIFLVK